MIFWKEKKNVWNGNLWKTNILKIKTSAKRNFLWQYKDASGKYSQLKKTAKLNSVWVLKTKLGPVISADSSFLNVYKPKTELTT